MRDRDRFWWVSLTLGLAFCVGGVIVPYIAVRVIPTDDPYITSTGYWQVVGLVGLLMLICLGGGLVIVVMAVRERRRHRIRLVALQNDPGVMPLAEIRTEPAAAPDVAKRPLELMWRTGKATGTFYGVILGVQAVLVVLAAGLDVFVFIASIFMPPQPTTEDLLNGTAPHPMSIIEIIWHIALAGLGMAIIVALVVVSVRATPFLFGRPFGVSATNQGIDAQTEWGSRVHISWNEAQLLEVASGDAHIKRRFSLYAPGKRISWTEYMVGLGAQYVPVGVTMNEMTLRHAALLNLIAARAGLAPRTLAKSLESKPAQARAVKRASVVIVLLVLALILAGITTADFILPPTPISWVNWASVGSLALSTLFLVVASAWPAFAKSALPPHASPPSVGAPSFDAPGVAYVLTWRPPLLRRLVLIFIGLCLAVNLIPGVWELLLSFGVSLPGYHPDLLSDGVFTFMGRFMLGSALAVFGLIGLALVYGGVLAATAHIRADKDGLMTGSGKRQQLMPWSSVQDISWGPGIREQFAYLVKTDVPTIQASWPADPQSVSANPPRDGAIPIGPDELAALVAVRSGKPIRVRDEGEVA